MTRELSGDSAGRIVDAMRDAVAERGIAGATFEHVAAQAGVSRGLLHYYFGTKERLLVEIVRRDSENRVEMLDEPLRAAGDVDGVLDVLVSSLMDLIENDPGFFIVLFDLFAAGRRNEEIGREVGGAVPEVARSRRPGARGEGGEGAIAAPIRGRGDGLVPVRDQ